MTHDYDDTLVSNLCAYEQILYFYPRNEQNQIQAEPLILNRKI